MVKIITKLILYMMEHIRMDYIMEKENYMRKKLKIIIKYMKDNLNLENMMVKEYTMSMIG